MIETVMLLALTLAPLQDDRPRVECTKGPAPKTIAALPWLAYGCSDDSTVLLASPKDNPVTPYSFILVKGGAGYDVYGQGTTGDQAASEAAARNLKAMTPDQFNALAREANALPAAKP